MGISFLKPKITQANIDSYERDGVVHLKSVITDEELSKLRLGVAKQIANKDNSLSAYDFEDMQRQAFSSDETELDFGTSQRFDIELLKFIVETDPEARPVRDKVADDGKGSFFHDAAGWRHYPEIKDVACQSALPEIASSLMRSEYIHFWEDTTFVKAPKTAQRTVFHQDWSYFQIDGDKCCIIWIPLDPVDAENGRMEYIIGSHKTGNIYAPNIFFAQSASPVSPYEKLPDIEGNRENYNIVNFDCQPGDVIIHHVKTIHGSGGNLSNDRMRRAVSFRYCGDDIRYFDKPGAIEQQYLKGKLDNGDLLNEEDYPLVWPPR